MACRKSALTQAMNNSRPARLMIFSYPEITNDNDDSAYKAGPSNHFIGHLYEKLFSVLLLSTFDLEND